MIDARTISTWTAVLAAAAVAAGCGSDGSGAEPLDCSAGGGEGALSRCLEPTLDASYYVEQSLRYFDTLDSGVGPFVQPSYSELVARFGEIRDPHFFHEPLFEPELSPGDNRVIGQRL